MNGDNKYMAGTTATYTCNTNYALSAGVSDVLTCAHGSWLQHTSPQCVQVCSNPSNGTRVSFNPPQTDGTFRNATIATYTCTTDYAFPVGVGETQICSSGVWVGGKPQCQPGNDIICKDFIGNDITGNDITGNDITCNEMTS
ncbi:uncharacterized protein LOC144747703 [Ciona intestinalis]